VAGKRRARLNEQLKRELSERLRTQVRDPRIGHVTVTAVQVTTDLSFAKVHVLMGGDATEREAALQGLSAAAPFLRTALAKTLTIRRVPELRFQEDLTLEHARRIEKVLAEVMPPAERDAPEPESE
jgi:ribosome-binding factor A